MEDEVDQDDVELANPDLFYEVGDVFTKLGYKLLEYHPIRFFTLVDNPFDLITVFFKRERQALLFKRRGFDKCHLLAWKWDVSHSREGYSFDLWIL